MKGKVTTVSLDTLGNGGAVELFDRELVRVLDNIRDPNTDYKTIRSVSVELLVKPNEDRESAAIKVSVRSKLAAPRGIASQIFIGEHEGKTVAVTYDPKQTDLLREDGVLPIKKAGADR